jgi:hypothetical protein
MRTTTIRNLIEYLQGIADDVGQDSTIIASVTTSEHVPDVDSADWEEFCGYWRNDIHGLEATDDELTLLNRVACEFHDDRMTVIATTRESGHA